MNRTALLAAPLGAALIFAGLALAPAPAHASGFYHRSPPRVVYLTPPHPPRAAFYPAPAYRYRAAPFGRYYVPPRAVVRPPVYFGFSWGTHRHWRGHHYHHDRGRRGHGRR